MKTAVEAVFLGKNRQFNRRFAQRCGHYLVEPTACTPASGWEKGQVENQVGLVRERFFTPRLRMNSYEELNAWLLDKCIAHARAHRHPELPERTIWDVFEEERASLVEYRGRFDGFHAVPASVSKTCLVRFDNNKYSVSSRAVGRPVDIHAYAERIALDWRRAPVARGNRESQRLVDGVARDVEKTCYRTLAHAVGTRQTNLAVKLHGINLRAPPPDAGRARWPVFAPPAARTIPPLPWQTFAPPFSLWIRSASRALLPQISGQYIT